MKTLFKSLSILLLSLSVNAHASGNEITAEQLVEIQKTDKNLVVIDSRSGDWFDGTVIKGAHQLGVDDTNETNLEKLGAKKDQNLVFYCQNHDCPASVKASAKAQKLGYAKTLEYRGGIEEWKKKSLPVETIKIAKK